MSNYEEFIARKLSHAPACGFEPGTLSESLFPFQADLVRWALRRGRAAIFASTGLGKTRMQVEWARHVPGDVLILAPLAVAAQTVREAREVGVDVTLCRDGADVKPGVNITNYDRLHRFDASRFQGVVLDESSIIKHHAAKTLQQLLEAFARTPYRLAATATPSPNDYTELATHAEFLGICKRAEMLAEFFVHDGGDTALWRLKGHARSAFWQWVASWGALVRDPSDLGYDAESYKLPELRTHHHIIAVDHRQAHAAGFLFVHEASDLMARRQARRASLDARCEEAAAVVNADRQPWVVWCDLNDEGDMLEELVANSIQISGSDPPELKEMANEWFVGSRCICSEPMFRAKLAAWQKEKLGTGQNIIKITESSDSPRQSHISEITRRSARITCADTTKRTRVTSGLNSQMSNVPSATAQDEPNTPLTQRIGSNTKPRSENGKETTQRRGSGSGSGSSELPLLNTKDCSPLREEDAPFAERGDPTRNEHAYPSTTATPREEFEGCCAGRVTSGLENSTTTQTDWSERRCICGHQDGRRVLISKSSIFGFGLNWQHCSRMAFVGVTDSWEAYFQSVRRIWRFGQRKTCDVHIFASESEGAVIRNLERKQADAEAMARELSAETRNAVISEVRGSARTVNEYRARTGMKIPAWLRSEGAAS